MSNPSLAERLGPLGDPLAWHLLLVVALSAAFESWFPAYRLNAFDEGWPLYAAMQLHEGGVLYRDAFFVFPPGHLLPAWLGYALDPPGVLVARYLYAAFDVALCAAIYLLGRRFVPPGFALLAACLVAVAAPHSHSLHLLFGYRYLVWTALALLAFAKRLEVGDHRWTFLAGVLAGIALCFRLTPAFAVSCAVALGALAASRSWRSWLRDGTAYAAGLLLVTAPALAWFAASVGLETLWREVVVRAVVMTDLTSLPVPELGVPPGPDRESLSRWFVALQFRLYPLLYGGYALVLGGLWIRSLARGRAFPHPLLLAVVVWGGVYFLRTLGRADVAHLDSAVPPACLVLAHLLAVATGRARTRPRTETRRAPRPVPVALGAVAFAGWVLLQGSDRYREPDLLLRAPIPSAGGAIRVSPSQARVVNRTVEALREHTREGDTILDLASSPIYHVLAGRLGPGLADVVVPGTFLDDAEEIAFVERLAQSPPAAVVWPSRDFDGLRERSIERIAPRLAAWVRRNYASRRPGAAYHDVLLPRSRVPGEGK